MGQYIPYQQIADQFDIRNGDTLLIGSDITRMAIEALKNGEKINLDLLIESFMNKVGEEGTLLFPTFNWGFCSGEGFDYNKTVSMTGALTNAALKRNDFRRTRHPIYSFAVWGKDAEYLYGLNNISSFGPDSPFAYLHQKKAKMLILGLDYQRSFTFVHYVEESEKVPYRFMKSFTGNYVDEAGNTSVRTYSMYVRDLDRGVVTEINPIGRIMEEQGASIQTRINDFDSYLVDLEKSYEIIQLDIRENHAANLYRIQKD